MIEINTAVYDAVKAGSVKEVRFFSDNLDPRPNAPYAVIKQEQSAENDKIVFRIFAHFRPGEQDRLDHYIRYELNALMYAPRTLTGRPRFRSLGGWGNTVSNNDDGTISCDKAYYVPVIIY
jgi:hypothetical protein